MVDVISNIVTDKQDIKNQLGTIPNVLPVVKRFSNSINPKKIVTKQITRSIAGAMIWGSAIFGVWGTSKYGNTLGSSFILNSQNFGVLGTNSIGANGSEEALYSVIPNNNVFIEYFGQSDYINTTNSTGTIDTINETYTITGTQILESEIIAKPRGPISGVKILSHDDLIDTGLGMVLGTLSLGVTTFADDNVSIEFSNDGGATWTLGNENEILTFATTTTDDELKYRIIGNAIISNPIFIQINP